MLRSMPARTLHEWMAFDELEPLRYQEWALRRMEGMLAQGLAMFASANRDRKKRPEAYTAGEFLGEDGAYRPPKKAQELWEKIKAIAGMFGIKAHRKDGAG